MELFYPVDCERLPLDVEAELVEQMGCNLESSEIAEVWLDKEELPEHVRIVTHKQFMEDERYLKSMLPVFLRMQGK